MRIPMGLLAATAVLATASVAMAASPVARAGEWETVMGARKFLVCVQHDRSLDSMMSMAASRPGVTCSPIDYHRSGDVATFSLSCDVAGGRMVSHGTVTSTGPDSYTSRVMSHLEGGRMAIPDMNIVQTGRRLGDCKPGDRVSPY